jgi:tRNA pseudouridine55 synthase
MHGFLILDKPGGLSSAKALVPIKRTVGRGVKVGHSGTLDPFATGTLLVLLGDATRLAQVALGLDKTYRATLRFGVETETLDPEGAVVAEADPGRRPPARLAEKVRALVGEIEQTPPAHSAVRVGGRRAYELARRGEAVEIAPRTVTVREARIEAESWPVVILRVTCGSGTYLRALARDLGRSLGLPAHLTALRRTSIGPFPAREGAPPERFPDLRAVRRFLRPPLELTRAAGLPVLVVGQEDARSFAQGRDVEGPGMEAGRVAVTHRNGAQLLGLGTATADGRLRPDLVLRAQAEALLR